MVIVERGFWSDHLVVNGMAPLARSRHPIMYLHIKDAIALLDYIFGRGLINRGPPFISTGVEKFYLYFSHVI